MKISVAPDTDEIVFRCTVDEGHQIIADAGVSQREWASRACDAMAGLQRLLELKARRVAAVEVEHKLARELAGADDDCG